MTWPAASEMQDVKTDPVRRGLLAGMAGAAAVALSRGKAAAVSGPALREIAPGVFVLQGVNDVTSPANQGATANLGCVVGDDAVAAIDSGGSLVHARAFLAAIREATGKPIKFLINTHMHPDHVFGNAVFRDEGAEVVGHRNLPAALAARGSYYLRSYRDQLGDALMEGVQIVPPSRLVADLLSLDLGGRVLELRAWDPAHTDNDVTVHDPATGVLFAGDLLFVEHLPTLDGSLLGWIRQLPALGAIPAQASVPGHGPSPVDWPGAMRPQQHYFETLADDLRKAIAAGTPLAAAVRTAASSERGKWELFETYNGRNATVAYAELEWE